MRRIFERLLRGTTLRRALPAEFRGQQLYLTPDARLAYLFRSLARAEKRLLESARELVGSGDVVWDVGANCGVFAIAAAVLSGARGFVLAVEPDPFLARLLGQSGDLLKAPDARLEIVQAAVAEAPGSSAFKIALRGRAASWLDGSEPSSQAGGTRSSLQVEVTTLDALLEKRRVPTLVKLDVEGSEVRVLKGATHLLSEVRPVLLLEVSSICRQEVGSLLRRHRYQLFDAFTNPSDRLRLDEPAENTLAIPGRPAQG